MMRRAGVTYANIATHIGINPNTVKTWCRRAGITPDTSVPQVADPVGVWCLACGARIKSVRPAKFCSEECRCAWWHAHPEAGQRRAYYQFTCPECGQGFAAYGNKTRVYCSHACYIRHRFGTWVAGDRPRPARRSHHGTHARPTRPPSTIRCPHTYTGGQCRGQDRRRTRRGNRGVESTNLG